MNFFSMCLMVVMSVFAFGCSSTSAYTHESIVEEVCLSLEEIGTLLESVKDEDTAEDILSDLEDVRDRLSDLGEVMEGFPDPTEEQEERLAEKYERRMYKARGKITALLMNLNQVLPRDVMQDIKESLDK